MKFQFYLIFILSYSNFIFGQELLYADSAIGISISKINAISQTDNNLKHTAIGFSLIHEGKTCFGFSIGKERINTGIDEYSNKKIYENKSTLSLYWSSKNKYNKKKQPLPISLHPSLGYSYIGTEPGIHSLTFGILFYKKKTIKKRIIVIPQIIFGYTLPFYFPRESNLKVMDNIISYGIGMDIGIRFSKYSRSCLFCSPGIIFSKMNSTILLFNFGIALGAKKINKIKKN